MQVLSQTKPVRECHASFSSHHRAPSFGISSVSHFFSGSSVYAFMFCQPHPHLLLRLLSADSVGAVPVLPTSQLTPGQSSPSQLNSIADAFPAPLRSDRLNGLFPTVVFSFAQGGRSLGLVYSPCQSIVGSIPSGKGVYHSRRHGLWRKGETSGATQDVIPINLDCAWIPSNLA